MRAERTNVSKSGSSSRVIFQPRVETGLIERLHDFANVLVTAGLHHEFDFGSLQRQLRKRALVMDLLDIRSEAGEPAGYLRKRAG